MLEEKPLTGEELLQQILNTLNGNGMQQSANGLYELCSYVDSMTHKVEDMTEEIAGLREEIKRMQGDTLTNRLKQSLSEATDRLEKRCMEIKEQIFEVKEGIADTNRTIAKIDSFGKGMREAGHKIANTFRTFADMEEVDYSDKEKKFSKTEVSKKPWQWQKKVYESMVLRLDAAIDKVEDLSRDVELDHMEKKQADKPKYVTDIREEIDPTMSVAEPSEYQYGAEAFEEVYPKMDAEIKSDMKAPSVPKTGKAR